MTFPDTSECAVPEVGIGDEVRLRKMHPCGSRDWRVTRTGADIGLECAGCKRRVLLALRAGLLGDLVRRVFRGSRAQLLCRLAEGRKLSEEERGVLERILKEDGR